MVSDKKTFVSVIIPTHDRANLLPRAIRSVLQQTYSHLECIVVDDASTDDIEEVVRQCSDDRLVYLSHDTNRGASAARNTGLTQARGHFIAFLDDDDEWLPTKLAKQVALLQHAPKDVGLVYCWMDYYEGGELVYSYHPTLRGHVFEKVLDRQRLGACSTLLVRREVVEEVGGFDEALPRGNDGDFIRRVCLNRAVDLVPEVLVKMHIGHGDRITSTDAEGIHNAIRGEQAKLEKFGPELEARPDLHAIILRTISQHWTELGDVERAEQLLQQASQLEKSIPLSRRVCRGLDSQIRVLGHGMHNMLRLLRGRITPNFSRRRAAERLTLAQQRLMDRYKLNDLDRIYPEEWFAERKDGVWLQDIQSFCRLLWERFEPKSVADVGCGPGLYLKCFQQLGARRVLGIEGADNALKHAAVENIVQHDLRKPFRHSSQYDMVLCLEVAEHIHKRYSGVLVDTIAGLCRPSTFIIFTAAPPGQGGLHHINLQPREFWIDKFAKRHCSYLDELSATLSAQLDLRRLQWLKSNIMIFEKRTTADG